MKKVLKMISFILVVTLCMNALSVSHIEAKSSAVPLEEMKGVWISYLEFSSAGVSNMTKKQFQRYIDSMFERISSMGMNTVIVQVRPNADAMYPSKYFPWSVYASGKQGKSPGYDPTEYMVWAAHKKGLKFYAWINPYRVSAESTDFSKLSTDNMAKKWRESKNVNERRNVLSYQNGLYFNPSQKSVRTLIVNGIKELVMNYDLEGIVFDDYFYPSLGSTYKTNFDAKEYREYKKICLQNGNKPKSIENWRRSNISALLKRVKTAIHNLDSSLSFGVSPQGNISNLNSSSANYCDVKKWMNSKSYLDFICPQIYWSKENPVSPYEKVVKQWINLGDRSKVKLYVGIAVYKAGMSRQEANALSPADLRWSQIKTNLKEQVVIARKTEQVSGFMFYRYDNMVSSKAKVEMKNLQTVLNK